MPQLKGRATTLLFGFQADFPTYATAWQTLTAYAHGIGQAKGFVDDPMLGRGLLNARDPVGSAPSLPLTEGPLEAAFCLTEMGYWLKLFFGSPVTTGAGDFVHVFKSGAAALPFATLQRKLSATDWRRVKGVMGNTLSLRAEKVDGYPRLSLGLIGRDEVTETTGLAGVVTGAVPLLRPSNARALARWDGVLMGSTTSVSLNFSNNLERINDLNGSEAPGTIDPGDVTLSGDMTIRYSDATWEALAAAETPGRLELEWSHPSAPATKLLNLDMKRVLITPQGLPITGPGGVSVTYQWRAEQQAAEPALIATLKNQTAAYA